ncbi:MAG: PepSY domain-containing protein [Gammaproteobacteria bacterium]|nr:PepSY domain-containing protein [Gammaproteobacteria bacterium]MBQ0840366.1 PepSY domain-containing protein [Gammaproteobacteria bacterium]
MRKQLIAWHKYLGLAFGLLLSLIGLSGSLLVFDHALDERLWPETLSQATPQQAVSLAQVLANAQTAAVQYVATRQKVNRHPQPSRLSLSRQPASPHVVRFSAQDTLAGPIEVSVAPATGEILAVRVWGTYTMSWLYKLHHTLLAGTTGKYIVGAMGVLLLFFCISGLAVWWPKYGRWRRALRIQRGAGRFRLFYDLHKTLGFYLLPVLMMIAVSGFSLIFHAPVKTFISRILPMDKPPIVVASFNPAFTGTPPSLDEVVAIGAGVFPKAELKRLYLPSYLPNHLPSHAMHAYRLRYRQDAEYWSNHAASEVWIHAQTGKVLSSIDILESPIGNQLMAWVFPLHNGDALGLAGRWMIFFCGWVPLLLFASGLYMYCKKTPALTGARVINGHFSNIVTLYRRLKPLFCSQP